jgi:ornithine cyclodeaminase/alanine dehydrogenase-like protein (mu-crystallin family)
MTNVMTNGELLYLSQSDVIATGLTIREVIDSIEEMFRQKGMGQVEMPPKPGVHPQPDSFIHAMPAYIPALGSVGVKWVSGYPQNQAKGLPYINGLLILNDPETGIPIAVMDCIWITAVRTGAATAVAAKYLARQDSRTIGILGCGVQGKSNLEALCEIFKAEKVFAYDINPEISTSFAATNSAALNIQVVCVQTPREAVSGCDIVVTAGPILRTPHATIKSGWLSRGSFASLVDFDSYWSSEALSEVQKFCTDDIPQFEHYREMGYFQNVTTLHAELGEIITGKKPGRETTTERTIACNLGIALDDMAVAPLVLRRAIQLGIGKRLAL